MLILNITGVDKMAIDKMAIDKMAIGKMAIVNMAIVKMAIGKMAIVKAQINIFLQDVVKSASFHYNCMGQCLATNKW